jgi:hypothetical protein
MLAHGTGKIASQSNRLQWCLPKQQACLACIPGEVSCSTSLSLPAYLFGDLRRDDRCRGVGAHTSCIGPGVTITNCLVILCTGNRQVGHTWLQCVVVAHAAHWLLRLSMSTLSCARSTINSLRSPPPLWLTWAAIRGTQSSPLTRAKKDASSPPRNSSTTSWSPAHAWQAGAQ